MNYYKILMYEYIKKSLFSPFFICVSRYELCHCRQIMYHVDKSCLRYNPGQRYLVIFLEWDAPRLCSHRLCHTPRHDYLHVARVVYILRFLVLSFQHPGTCLCLLLCPCHIYRTHTTCAHRNVDSDQTSVVGLGHRARKPWLIHDYSSEIFSRPFFYSPSLNFNAKLEVKSAHEL